MVYNDIYFALAKVGIGSSDMPIVAGLTDVLIAIPVPADKLRVMLGDDVADPVVINKPLPTVILLVRLKYGIEIGALPLKSTPAIALIFANVSAVVADAGL